MRGGMAVHQTAFWVLLIACSLVSAVWFLGGEIHRRTGDRGLQSRVERLVMAGLTGVGLGMSVAALLLLAAALVVRLGG